MIRSAKILKITHYQKVFRWFFPYAVLVLDIGKYTFLDRNYLAKMIGGNKVGDTILVDERVNCVKAVDEKI